MKKMIKLLLFIIVLLLLYAACGIIISYRRWPDVDGAYKSNFRTSDFYSDSVSCDRARIIEDNDEALLERLRMIEQAKERIILSTFEFRADKSGMDVLASLLAAAKRGVSVKILADGGPALIRMYGNEYFHCLAAEENVKIKIYNKPNPFLPWKTMGRLHDKYLIIDNGLYLLGGRNTYDYFLGSAGYKNYDRDVLVYCADPKNDESSIHQLEKYFKSVWESKDCAVFLPRGTKKERLAQKELEKRYKDAKNKYPSISKKADYRLSTLAVNKITLLSNPIHAYAKEPTLFYSLAELMKDSDGEILIHTPYVICNDMMYNAFREICEKNENVSLLTNSVANNGNLFGAADYCFNKEKLADTGLDIYEYEGGVSYHGKSLSIGDRLSIVGSFNMDMRSAYLDTELMLAIDGKALNEQLRDNMREYSDKSVRFLDSGGYENPNGVKRQKLSEKKKRKISVMRLFSWLRFLI